MQRVYVDTCVYMDAMGLNRSKDTLGDPHILALSFFDRIMAGEYGLVTSSWLYHEFKKVAGDNERLSLFINDLGLAPSYHAHVVEEDIDYWHARELSISNLPDARHVVLAKKGEATFLTTRDFKDFQHFFEFMEHNGIKLVHPETL